MFITASDNYGDFSSPLAHCSKMRLGLTALWLAVTCFGVAVGLYAVKDKAFNSYCILLDADITGTVAYHDRRVSQRETAAGCASLLGLRKPAADSDAIRASNL